MSVKKEKIYSPEFRESSVKLAMESKNTIALD
jgi:transposase-like protein